MSCTICCERVERSLSTTSTRIFFTSICITHGMTHIMTMGNMMMSLGRKALRRIWRNSFCMRYRSVISGYSNLVLNFLRAMARKSTVMADRTATSWVTSVMPTPMIINLRMAEM